MVGEFPTHVARKQNKICKIIDTVFERMPCSALQPVHS
jgi:hypothetical protein